LYKYNDKVRFKDARGYNKEGVVREVNSDGTYFIEVEENILPDINEDMIIPLGKFTLVVRKQKFHSWQAYVKPEWITGKVAYEKAI